MTLSPGVGVVSEVQHALEEFEEIVAISPDNTLVANRLDGTRRARRPHVTRERSASSPRMSGLDIDVRRDQPFAAYRGLSFSAPVAETVDVKARNAVKPTEGQNVIERPSDR